MLCSDPISHKTPQKHPPAKLEEEKVALGEKLLKNTTRELALPEADTISVRRKLAWDAEGTNEDMQEQPRGDGDQERGEDKQICVGELEKLDTQDKFKTDRVKEG